MRTMRVFVIAVLLLALVGFESALAGGSQEEPQVEEITVGLLARGVSDALKPFLDDFEEETGVRVHLEQHAFDALRDRMMLEFAADSGYYDIVYSSPGFLGELVANDHIIPLNDMMDEYGFEEDDFLPAAIEINRFEGEDEIWGFPYLADTSILLYRKDLFNDPDEREAFEAEYGYELPIPSVDDPFTTQEFLDVAQFFTRDGMYGFVYPQTGVAYGNLHIMPWIWTFGGNYYDSDYNVTINSPEAVEAVRFARALQDTQPEGVLGYDYGDHIPWFYEGNAAMTMGWFHMGVEANDPEHADVAGDVGYAPVPYHPESGLDHGVAVLGGGGVAITSDSRAPEVAFEFLNWMFGDTERALEWYLNGGGATRPEIYEHPRVYEEYPWAEDFFPVANYSLANVARQRPTLPNSHSIFEVTSEMWHNVALDDMTPEEGVRWAQEQLEPLLEPFQD